MGASTFHTPVGADALQALADQGDIFREKSLALDDLFQGGSEIREALTGEIYESPPSSDLLGVYIDPRGFRELM